MQKWKALVKEFNPVEQYINDSQQLVYLKQFIRDVPDLKDINKLVDVMCDARWENPDIL